MNPEPLDRSPVAIETRIREMIAEALRVRPHELSATTALAALGLTSLASVRLSTRLWQAGFAVMPDRVLAGETIASLTGQIVSADSSTGPGEPLRFDQRLHWAALQRYPPEDRGLANAGPAFRVLAPVDLDRLALAYRRVIQRHAALRSHIVATPSGPRLTVRDQEEAMSFCVIGAAHLGDRELHVELERERGRAFGLVDGPSTRLTVFTRGPNDTCVLFSVPHLLVDVASSHLLLEELLDGYDGTASEGRRTSGVRQFADYARWLDAYGRSSLGSRDREFWASQRVDREALPVRGGTEAPTCAALQLDVGQLDRLRTAASRTGGTLFEALLVATAVAIHHETGRRGVLVRWLSSGRRRPFTETVGWLSLTIHGRLFVSPEDTILDLLQQSQLVAREGFRRQYGQPAGGEVGAATNESLESDGFLNLFSGGALRGGESAARARSIPLEPIRLASRPRPDLGFDPTLFGYTVAVSVQAVLAGGGLEAAVRANPLFLPPAASHRVHATFVRVLHAIVEEPATTVEVLGRGHFGG